VRAILHPRGGLDRARFRFGIEPTEEPQWMSPSRARADLWDRYKSTAWMKAWTEREAATIKLPD
jgi:hypothetical protein